MLIIEIPNKIGVDNLVENLFNYPQFKIKNV